MTKPSKAEQEVRGQIAAVLAEIVIEANKHSGIDWVFDAPDYTTRIRAIFQLREEREKISGLRVFCYQCGRGLSEPGGLLFSPPNKNGKVDKRHICKACYSSALLTAGLDEWETLEKTVLCGK